MSKSARKQRAKGRAGGARPGTEEARVRLPLYGEDREIAFEARVGPRALRDLLPAAREISRQLAGFARAQAEAEGRQVSCSPGCAACCRHLVPVSPVEAVALAEAVAALPADRRDAVRRRFAAAVARMEELGMLDPSAPRGRYALQSAAPPGAPTWEDVSLRYFAASIPCPLLEDERCSVYEERPLPCREYCVTTPPELCATLDPAVETVDRPAHLGDTLSAACAILARLPHGGLPLPLALEWAEVHGHRLRGVHDGEAMVLRLLEELGSLDHEPE